jgi:hypothetical protein
MLFVFQIAGVLAALVTRRCEAVVSSVQADLSPESLIDVNSPGLMNLKERLA